MSRLERQGNVLMRADLRKATLPHSTVADEIERRLPSGVADSVKAHLSRMFHRMILQCAYARDVLKWVRKSAPELVDHVVEVCEWIRLNPYARRVHRAVYELLGAGNQDRRHFARKWAVHGKDVVSCLESLNPPDKQRIRAAASKMDFAPPLSRGSMAWFVDTVVLPEARKLAGYKLRFISKYDSAYSSTDLEAELIQEGVRVAYVYDHMANELHFTNTVKRAMHHHMVRIISRHTTHGRRRLSSTTAPGREYEANLLSIDAVQHGAEDGDERSFHDTLTTDEQDFDAASILGDVLMKVAPAVETSFRLGLGQVTSDDYEQHIEKTLRVGEREDVVARTKAALSMNGLDWDAVTFNLNRMLTMEVA